MVTDGGGGAGAPLELSDATMQHSVPPAQTGSGDAPIEPAQVMELALSHAPGTAAHVTPGCSHTGGGSSARALAQKEDELPLCARAPGPAAMASTASSSMGAQIAPVLNAMVTLLLSRSACHLHPRLAWPGLAVPGTAF